PRKTAPIVPRPGLRRDDELITAPGERLPEQLFRHPAAVAFRAVDEVDAKLLRAIDDRLRAGGVDDSTELVRTETEGRQLHPGTAEGAVLHVRRVGRSRTGHRVRV